MTARSLICSGSRCTTSSGITARSSICSGSACAERFHGHGGAAMAAMAASWQQQPAQRARAGGGRNAGARPPRTRASRPASHLDTAFFARRGLHRRVLLLCGVVCRRHEVCKPRRKWSVDRRRQQISRGVIGQEVFLRIKRKKDKLYQNETKTHCAGRPACRRSSRCAGHAPPQPALQERQCGKKQCWQQTAAPGSCLVNHRAGASSCHPSGSSRGPPCFLRCRCS
jgi:hypothetical protein